MKKSKVEEETRRSKKKKSKGGLRYGISPEQFVEIWTASSNVADVVRATGLPKNAVYSRVNSYRKKGARLKKMPRPNKGMNIDALNAIIDSVKKKTKE